MALSSSGSITMAMIATELGISPTGLSLNDPRVRTLAGVASGPIAIQNLLGKQNFVKLNDLPTNQYNQGNAYLWFQYDGATTNATWLEGQTVKVLAIARGQCNVRIRNGGVTYNNCVEAQWFLADGTWRGVTNATLGTNRDMQIDIAPNGSTTAQYSASVRVTYS